MTVKQKVTVHIRWMIRRDMLDVLRIEEISFAHPWQEEDFIRCLRQRNCIGMVAEVNDTIVGYMIYELHKQRLHVLNFAVDRIFRRQGVGSQLIEKLKSKLSYERRNRVMLEVSERNLSAQLFFRASGFKAVQVLKDYYDQPPSDAYLMAYRFESEVS